MLLYQVNSTLKKIKQASNLTAKKTRILKKNFLQIFWKDKNWPLKGLGKKTEEIF